MSKAMAAVLRRLSPSQKRVLAVRLLDSKDYVDAHRSVGQAAVLNLLKHFRTQLLCQHTAVHLMGTTPFVPSNTLADQHVSFIFGQTGRLLQFVVSLRMRGSCQGCTAPTRGGSICRHVHLPDSRRIETFQLSVFYNDCAAWQGFRLLGRSSCQPRVPEGFIIFCVCMTFYLHMIPTVGINAVTCRSRRRESRAAPLNKAISTLDRRARLRLSARAECRSAGRFDADRAHVTCEGSKRFRHSNAH